MSLMEDARLNLGDPAYILRKDASQIPYANEVRAALANVHAQLHGSRTILVSMISRLVISTEIYRVPRLDIFQERGGLTSQFGAFGQTMRFIVYVVYSDERNGYMLRMDDIFSGIVAYMEISTMDRLLSADKIIDIENQIIVCIAEIMLAYDGDWETIWGGYNERVLEYSRKKDESVRMFLDLIEACSDSKKLARVDLHLSHYMYDRIRFTVLNGEVESFSFKQNSAIYIPENRINDYGSAGAESLLETFINANEISAFVNGRMIDSCIMQHESALVDELKQLTTSIDAVDLHSAQWLQRKITLRNQKALSESDDDDDEFFEFGGSAEIPTLAESLEENVYWSLQTDSDEDAGEDIWDGMNDT